MSAPPSPAQMMRGDSVGEIQADGGEERVVLLHFNSQVDLLEPNLSRAAAEPA